MAGNTITFSAAGTYNVVESVTDSRGVRASSPQAVVTVNQNPTITLAPSAQAINSGQSITFTNTTSGGTAPYLSSRSTP